MNVKIRKLNLEKLLFFDAEFVRANESLDIDSHEFELYQKKLRDRETGEYPEPNEVQQHYLKNAGLDPIFNKVVSVVIGFIKGNKFFYKKLEGSQREIIETFYTTVKETGLIPCGHNIIGFDLPSLRLKAFQSGVNMDLLPDKYNDSQKKPWNMTDAVIDTMEVTKGTFYYNLGLDSLCYLSGIESPKSDIDGSQVSDVYYTEGLNRISDYCAQDVLAVARLMCHMQEDTDRIQEVIERKDTPKVPLMERLYSNNELSEDIKQEIQTLTSKVKLTKKDKSNLETILYNIYIRDDFENNDQDSKAVKESKYQEVKEFVKTL